MRKSASTRSIHDRVQSDFLHSIGDDPEALRKYLEDLQFDQVLSVCMKSGSDSISECLEYRDGSSADDTLLRRRQIVSSWFRIVVRCWASSEFKLSFIRNPEKILQGEGIPIPESKRIVVVEAVKGEAILVIPSGPEGL